MISTGRHIQSRKGGITYIVDGSKCILGQASIDTSSSHGGFVHGTFFELSFTTIRLKFCTEMVIEVQNNFTGASFYRYGRPPSRHAANTIFDHD